MMHSSAGTDPGPDATVDWQDWPVPTPSSFQVDLRGMIALLGQHLYSRPQVYVRELLQNAVDALTARSRLTGDHDAAWSVRLNGASAPGEPVRCTDDGVGMTLAEVSEVLATVGRSSKRDEFELPAGDYLGQFGIGLLSCFMVTDRVIVRTRSVTGTPAVEWVGYSSGVFTATEISDDLPFGTTVEFVPRPDEAAVTSARAVDGFAREYGEYLDVPLWVNGERINRQAVWALPPGERDAEARSRLQEFGAELIGGRPLAAIPLGVLGADLAGTAFVLPYPPSPSARPAHRVYLGRMLVTDSCENLLPDWAFFVRAVATTTAANPTASREQLIDDEALAHLRQGLGAALRHWVDRVGREEPDLLAEFVSVHHLGLRSVAIHDQALAAAIVPWLPFETSEGRMPLHDFVRRWPVVRYVVDHDEFDTVASLAQPGQPVLNAGYVYDAALVRELPLILPGVTCVEVTASSALEGLAAPALADQARAAGLERRATAALAEVDCAAVVRAFDPADSTAFLVADPDLWRRLERVRTQTAPGLWSSMLEAMADSAPALDTGAGPASRLCLNWANPLIRRLAVVGDDVVADRVLRVLYCQAVLAAHRPLQPAERSLLSRGLDDLLALSMTEEDR